MLYGCHNRETVTPMWARMSTTCWYGYHLAQHNKADAGCEGCRQKGVVQAGDEAWAEAEKETTKSQGE